MTKVECMENGYLCGCGPAGTYYYCEEAYSIWDEVRAAHDIEDWATYSLAAARYAKHFADQEGEPR